MSEHTSPPERFPLSDRPGHDVHWTLAADLVRIVWAKHNATFAAAVRDWYGRPRAESQEGEGDGPTA